jgi:hypothetical protein
MSWGKSLPVYDPLCCPKCGDAKGGILNGPWWSGYSCIPCGFWMPVWATQQEFDPENPQDRQRIYDMWRRQIGHHVMHVMLPTSCLT